MPDVSMRESQKQLGACASNDCTDSTNLSAQSDFPAWGKRAETQRGVHLKSEGTSPSLGDIERIRGTILIGSTISELGLFRASE